jgi:hypothetical protein
MVGDYFFLGFLTLAGNFLYWVDFAHFMQSTEPSKPPDAKQARDWALDLKGMVSGKEWLARDYADKPWRRTEEGCLEPFVSLPIRPVLQGG